MKCVWLDVWLQAPRLLFSLCSLLPVWKRAAVLLDQKTWSCLASIMVESSSPGSGITAFHQRVKYFSTTPLFFTSGSIDVSLSVHGHFTYCAWWVKEKGGGGQIKKRYKARREKDEMFLRIILHMWSSWRSVSMNSLSAPKGKLFSAGIWGIKPEVLCFDPCVLPSSSPLPPDSKAWGRDW